MQIFETVLSHKWGSKLILADSTFLIDALRKRENVRKYLKANPTELLFTTEINVFELYLGIYSSKTLAGNPELLKKRQHLLEELLQKFQLVTLVRGGAIEAAQILGTLYRGGQPIDFRDGLIAGIARFNQVNKVLTRNPAHFQRIEGIEVISY